MQIFLPYTDIIEVAECLDNRRLHKQIVECKQIIKAITGESEAWKNHPIVKMYKDNVDFVYAYLSILERYWNLYKEYEHKVGFSRLINDLRNAKSRKDLEVYGKIINISPYECIYTNNIADLWEDNKKIKYLIPIFIKDEYLYTMRGRLYKKDSIYYNFFAPYEEYGDRNMYFVDGEWKYYKQMK